jgi:hypothetical protein
MQGSRNDSAASAQPVPLGALRIHNPMLRAPGERINA